MLLPEPFSHLVHSYHSLRILLCGKLSGRGQRFQRRVFIGFSAAKLAESWDPLGAGYNFPALDVLLSVVEFRTVGIQNVCLARDRSATLPAFSFVLRGFLLSSGTALPQDWTSGKDGSSSTLSHDFMGSGKTLGVNTFHKRDTQGYLWKRCMNQWPL